MQSSGQPIVYSAFILRFWPEAQSHVTPAKTWRFSLEDPRSGARRGFDDLEALLVFIESQLRVEAKEANEKF